MADPQARVELTASFIERLESIEAFLTEAGAPQAYDRLLDDLRRTVFPNLRRFPLLGRRYLDKPPQSAVRWHSSQPCRMGPPMYSASTCTVTI